MKRLLLFYTTLVFMVLPTLDVPAVQIDFAPTTWYEINSTYNPLTIEPSILEVGSANYQSRAFFEYSLTDIITSLNTIDSASVNFINTGRTNTVQVFTYEADAIPTSSDWWNNDISDTWQNCVLYGWDDPFSRGPNNVFDVLSGLDIAIQNDYSHFGIMVIAPSASGAPNTFSEISSNAILTVEGAAVPEPATFVLFCIGLLCCVYANRNDN